MPYKIVHDRDHYEVYVNGRFYCSADTIAEANIELESGGFNNGSTQI